MITIDGYLTQEKLQNCLVSILGTSSFIGKEVKVPATRKRWDMVFTINGRYSVVEFDGDSHYRDSLVIKADNEKDQIAKNLGYKVIRIPYWVQLTSDTLKYYFGIEHPISQTSPHGFITTKVFPASFCELGVERFVKELEGLPEQIKIDVKNSLVTKIENLGKAYVIPKQIEIT